jgi:hypothetical protein
MGFLLNPYRFTTLVTDPHFANVRLLWMPDGSGLNLDDQSSYNHTMTAFGSIAHGTSSPYWTGMGWAELRGGGLGDCIKITDAATLEPGADSFVLELIFAGDGPSGYIFGHGGGSVSHYDAVGVLARDSNNLECYASTSNTSYTRLNGNGGGIWTDFQKHHFALVRTAGDTWRSYLDGTRVLNVSTASGALNDYSMPFCIGSALDGSGNFTGNGFDGKLYGVRLTIGTDRGYTGASIAVPTEPWPTA